MSRLTVKSDDFVENLIVFLVSIWILFWFLFHRFIRFNSKSFLVKDLVTGEGVNLFKWLTFFGTKLTLVFVFNLGRKCKDKIVIIHWLKMS